ncbi:MAG TPA: DUF3575 domain-containing protein, partial [Gemmatimonadaceae bacterium]|nr:DUF3575 domain-containing protein [Gemmatimonadaceae bacterium]
LAAQGDAAVPSPRPAAVAAPRQALSINPVYAMFGVYTGEFERAVGIGTTLSLGASYWDAGGDGELDAGEPADGRISYFTSDLRLRYYPSGTALMGFSFGVSGGYARLAGEISDSEESAKGHAGGPTFGVELNYSWLLGERRNVALSTGLGAKRLFVREADNASVVYPTVKLGLGLAF